MEKALLNYLTTLTDNVFWLQRAKGSAYPCIVLNKVSKITNRTYADDCNLKQARIQCDCMATTYLGAVALGKSLTNLVNTDKRFIQDLVEFEGIFIEDERDLINNSETADQICGVSIDLIVWYKE